MQFNAIIKQITRLNHLYFDYYIELSCDKNQYETSIYQQRLRLFFLLDKLAKKIEKNNNTKKKFFFVKLEKLIEIIFAIHQLRFRITDATTFELCVPEMRCLQKNSDLFPVSRGEIRSALEAIDAFETLSENTLQIATANGEGMAFTIFIADLRKWHDAISDIIDIINLCEN